MPLSPLDIIMSLTRAPTGTLRDTRLHSWHLIVMVPCQSERFYLHDKGVEDPWITPAPGNPV